MTAVVPARIRTRRAQNRTAQLYRFGNLPILCAIRKGCTAVILVHASAWQSLVFGRFLSIGKATISFVISVRLSARTEHLGSPLDGFSLVLHENPPRKFKLN